MFNFSFKNTFFIWFSILLLMVSCGSKNKSTQKETISVKETSSTTEKQSIIVGADQLQEYRKSLLNKNIAIVANQTSRIKYKTRYAVNEHTTGVKVINEHLVDYLHYQYGNNIKRVFAPEHGFRGKADAGEHIKNGIDQKTKLPIISLYGKNKKPKAEQLKGIDVVLFDIQDVGVRFYTYISTLHYVMEACAEANIKVIVLDRPNPNAHYVDGPMLEKQHKSFVGMHPVPLVYGMTIGEYAQMINGEKWLNNGIQCDLTVVPLKNYNHQMAYDLPVIPSPNLPNSKSINLYPSLAFFEGTNVSCGRGTEMQFQVYGSPFLNKKYNTFTFTPQPNFGAKHPKHKGNLCYGQDLKETEKLERLNLEWLIEAYISTDDKTKFFNPFFTKLAGTKKLQKQIEQTYTYREIRKDWYRDTEAFKKIRAKYLLYQ
ncbi:MAG: DUF1343 domain-containing protein [Flavobacteriaceae bacterium]